MKIVLGADHGGFEVKKELKQWLVESGYEVVDAGAEKLEPEDDFVDYAKKAVEMADDEDRLILLCRNGVGMDIVAGRFMNIRCVLGFDKEQVRRARTDDDVNCLSLPADYIGWEKVKDLVKMFLSTKFSGKERFVRRLKKMEFVVL